LALGGVLVCGQRWRFRHPIAPQSPHHHSEDLMKPLRLLIGVSLLAITSMPPRALAETIVLTSTTSVENSGLLAHILPQFTRETGIEVHVLAQGTGQALTTAAHGDADLVLVHDPDAEAKFMAEGHGSTRTEIAWNDFIIVGPRSDPAHVMGGRDAVTALRAIYAARASSRAGTERNGCVGEATAEGRRTRPELFEGADTC
jgi:tungstate transport system substrate-binding protein